MTKLALPAKIKSLLYPIIFNIGSLKTQPRTLLSYLISTFYYFFFRTNLGFIKSNIVNKSVLILEPNSYHGELLPGFVKYFQDLGYNVDVLIRYELALQRPFCRMKWNFRVFEGSQKVLKNCLKNEKIKNYDYLFLSSTAYWETGNPKRSYLDYLGFTPQPKYGLLLVEHNLDPYLQIYGGQAFLKDQRLFSLNGFRKTPMLNPCYFGDIGNHYFHGQMRHFLVIGRTNLESKNMHLLFRTATSLVNKKIYNFRIALVGTSSIGIPQNLKNHIKNLGKLSFPDMFKAVDKCDFILPMLDYNVEPHHKYIDNTSSGIFQISSGFNKPCILDNNFASPYWLDNSNAILYRHANLEDGIIDALTMSKEKYHVLKKNLHLTTLKKQKLSIMNLKRATKKRYVS